MRTSNLRKGTPVMLRNGDNANLTHDITNVTDPYRKINRWVTIKGTKKIMVIKSFDIIGYMDNNGDWKVDIEYSNEEKPFIKNQSLKQKTFNKFKKSNISYLWKDGHERN